MTRHIRSIIFGVISFILFSMTIFYSDICFARVVHTGAAFLLIAPDARGRAIAQSGSVYSTGAKSAFYNPANLTSSGAISADISYLNYLPQSDGDLSYTSFYLSRDFGKWGHFGLSYNRLNIGNHFRYLDDYTQYTFFNYEEAFALYSAYNLGANGSAGVGIKYIHNHLIDIGPSMEGTKNVGSSFAVDLGVQLCNRFVNTTLVRDESNPSRTDVGNAESRGGMSFGLSFQNFGPNIKYNSYMSDRLPKRFLIAAGYQAVQTKYYEVNLTVDASKILIDMNDGFNTEWKEVVWSYGAELKYCKLIGLRIGVLNDQDGMQRYWTGGLGFGPDWLHLDYSYVFKSNEDWNKLGGEYAIGLAANLDTELIKKISGR
jgi:hypothetical protein